MASLALTRLTSLLEAKRFDHTLARAGERIDAARVSPTGIEALDARLPDGWRRGEVSELVGGRSSGLTSVLLASLAAATRRGELVGLVDAVDRFDPLSAAAAGLDLERVLWVRGPGVTVESARPGVLDRAVRQAIRAFDLIVRAGGFGVVALDLADVPARVVRAVPFTTWLRLAHAAEGRETACLLVGDAPMGKSARGVSVRLAASARWTGASAQSRRLAGLAVHADVVSTRSDGGRATFSV